MATLRSIKLGSALAALAIFFLPWLDIQYSANRVATQTGFQTVSGEVTASEGMQVVKDSLIGTERLGLASQVAGALVCVLLAIVCLLTALLRKRVLFDVMGSALCALAVMLLIAQAMEGFPAKLELIESVSTDQASHHMDMGALMAVIASIEVEHLPAFSITCVLLGIPVLILAGQLLNRLRPGKPAVHQRSIRN